MLWKISLENLIVAHLAANFSALYVIECLLTSQLQPLTETFSNGSYGTTITMKWQIQTVKCTVLYQFHKVTGTALLKSVYNFAKDKGTNFN